MLGTGKIATMVARLVVDRADAGGRRASKDDIGYLPFPDQVDGKFHSVVGGDYKNGINVNSKNKATARAWVDWFANESDYATDQGGVSPLVTSASSRPTLADFRRPASSSSR